MARWFQSRRKPVPATFTLKQVPPPPSAVYRCGECNGLSTAVLELAEEAFYAPTYGFSTAAKAITRTIRLCHECITSARAKGNNNEGTFEVEIRA